MSTLKVEVTVIDEILAHPNAERLELARVKGWMCIVQKGRYKAGDKCVYFPIDSVLPPAVESKLFPPDSKVKLHNSRIRTIKLRGAISQGLVADPALFALEYHATDTDVTDLLGVKKYEPPASSNNGIGNVRCAASKKQINPNFRKYTDLENIKNYTEVFQPGEQVSVTEKIHGTNFRCGYVPFVADTFLKKVKKFFGFAPDFEFVYGSRNVQLQNKLLYNGFYDENVYSKIVEQYNLRELLEDGQVIYGEIYGFGIQANYTYGCREGEHKLVVFDLMQDDKYVSPDALRAFLEEVELPGSPELYRGPFDYNKMKELTQGDSVLAPEQKVREGIVIKPLEEAVCYMGRKVLKFINDEYLLKDDNTDFH